jgi:mono/diheme cytochrome c family protein
MGNRTGKLLVAVSLLFMGALTLVDAAQEPERRWAPTIPKTWDDEAMRTLEVPLPDPAATPKHVTAEYYYRIPVRPIYKSYPVYHPAKEPPGYLESLATYQPEIAFDPSRLETERDWIRAGEAVFDAPIELLSGELLNTLVRTASWYSHNGVPVTKDGVLPFMRYVVREKGKVELGILSCAQCHTRVLPDGSAIKGAQGNFPDDRAFGYETRLDAAKARDKGAVLTRFRKFFRRTYAAPWLRPDPNARPERMSLEALVAAMEAIPPGVCARQGTSVFYPPHIPDLIGVRDRRYLDATGHVRHRSIGDLMRYAAINQGEDLLASFGGFRPAGELPDPSEESRYSDEQLYALALYVYSLEPPPNPNKLDALAAQGQKVFDTEGCAVCHTPPLYTNNKLTPADGFAVPADHAARFDVMPISVGTDPDLTLKSRRGSGYYRVPSLKGVWYRGPFGHGGSVATLEDWFNPRRVRAGYVPTGFRGYGVRSRAVKGHLFGLDLSVSDRKALVAFLKTL